MHRRSYKDKARTKVISDIFLDHQLFQGEYLLVPLKKSGGEKFYCLFILVPLQFSMAELLRLLHQAVNSFSLSNKLRISKT